MLHISLLFSSLRTERSMNFADRLIPYPNGMLTV